MIYTPSLKIFTLMALLVAVLVQNTYAQIEDDEAPMEIPDCPLEYLAYYKNCRGSLNECSTCLGNAERTCESELKQQGKDSSICVYCTTTASIRCGSAKNDCYGDHECGGGGYKCIRRTCTYDP